MASRVRRHGGWTGSTEFYRIRPVLNRREFVGASVGLAAAAGFVRPSCSGDAMRDLCEHGIDAATSAGATYADIRICRYRFQNLNTKDQRVQSISDSESFGFGVRVIANEAWGFAASDVVTKEEIARVARLAVDIAKASATAKKTPVRLVPAGKYVDRWVTPHEQDPFEVSIAKKVGLLLGVNEAILKVKGIKTATSFLDFEREHRYLMNTDGSFIEQIILRSHPGCAATAVGDGGFETRTYQVTPMNCGYELIDRARMLEKAPQIADEAVEKLKAPKGPTGVKKDLVLLPAHLCLTIHESVAHPTELDRALGWEADYAGTTFATLDKLGKFQYGSPLMNIVGDRTHPGLRSTVGYDDDGVKTRSWYIIKNGLFTGYQTTRDTAWYVGEEASNACAWADSWGSIPFLRIPNISLEADPKGPDLDALIGDTKDGILIDGRGSYSIDQQRYNFQFGGDAFWEIKNGRKGRMLKDVTYNAITPEFWSKLDAVCSPEFWEGHGITNDGKGQPGQRGQQSHGCPPARFRGIDVGGAFGGKP